MIEKRVIGLARARLSSLLFQTIPDGHFSHCRRLLSPNTRFFRHDASDFGRLLCTSLKIFSFAFTIKRSCNLPLNVRNRSSNIKAEIASLEEFPLILLVSYDFAIYEISAWNFHHIAYGRHDKI